MGNLIRPDTLTTHFKAFLKRHNLPVIRLHELRHTCASILIVCGVSMKAVQEWLGHSTFNTTADIYSHLNYSSKLGIEDTFSSVFGGKPTPIEQTSPGAMSKIQKIFIQAMSRRHLKTQETSRMNTIVGMKIPKMLNVINASPSYSSNSER